MRVEQLSQTARGIPAAPYDCLIAKEKILKELERVKWFLWHGNVFRTDETLTDLLFEVDSAVEEDREAQRPVHLVLKKWARAPRNSVPISTTMLLESSTTGSVIDVGNEYRRALWNQRSTSSSPSGSSRSSKCDGHRAGPSSIAGPGSGAE